MVTVTMPISEYEAMKSEIEKLKRESIYSYTREHWYDAKERKFDVVIDVNEIVTEVERARKGAQQVRVKYQ